MHRMILSAAVLLVYSPPLTVAAADLSDVAATARAIAAEAVRGNDDPAGRPLPLAGHWNTGQYGRAPGFDPDWQIEQIEAGHMLLPWFQLNAPWWEQLGQEYYDRAIRRAAELKLPITFIGTQFEAGLTAMKEFYELPAEQNPNVVTPDGQVLKMVDPFGPVEPWRQVGRNWTELPIVARLQRLHPDPPLVIFLSNNEHSRLTWKQVERSKRYLDLHGRGRDDAFNRRVVADCWIERYRALQAGMRDGLTAPAWKRGAIFVGYDAFGPPHLGRWGGWEEYSLWSPGRIDPSPATWDGGSPSFYVHSWNPSTDHTVWGPQVEAMNWPFMLDDALRLNPRFWWEISIWDGSAPNDKLDQRKTYADRGQTFDPTRYRGFVQFGMWLLRPRVVREFRGWTEPRKQTKPYFAEVIAAVDRVHADATLTEFWRKGELVSNRAAMHPYQERIDAEFAARDRWFLLETDLAPPRPWKMDTPIPVFAVALVLGEPAARRWLIYAHAPLGEQKAVTITLPDYGPVRAPVAVGGTFLLVDEQAKTTIPVAGQ